MPVICLSKSLTNPKVTTNPSASNCYCYLTVHSMCFFTDQCKSAYLSWILPFLKGAPILDSPLITHLHANQLQSPADVTRFCWQVIGTSKERVLGLSEHEGLVFVGEVG